MKIHAGVEATNDLAELRQNGLLSGQILTNELRKPKSEGSVVSVRLSPEASAVLDLLSLKFNKPRGHVARTFIEAAIFQVGGEYELLGEVGQRAFEVLMSMERERQKNKDMN